MFSQSTGITYKGLCSSGFLWTVLFCFVLYCLVVPCPALPCPVLSCNVMSCYALHCPILSCHVMPCYVMECHVLFCLALYSFVAFCMMFYVFCVVLCVVFCTGNFVMVPLKLNLTYLHCLQHYLLENLFNSYFLFCLVSMFIIYSTASYYPLVWNYFTDNIITIQIMVINMVKR